MKAFTGQYCAQGDVSIFRADSIPDGLSLADKDEQGRYVLAHSETGHSHVIDGNTVRVFRENEFVSYLDVQKPAKVVHLRSFDTHAPIALEPGKYRVTRQREYVSEGFRVAQD